MVGVLMVLFIRGRWRVRINMSYNEGGHYLSLSLTSDQMSQ
jgi:hypothetical protein